MSTAATLTYLLTAATGLLAMVGGFTLAITSLAGAMFRQMVRARKARLWIKLPPLEEAWNTGYDDAIDDFPCTNDPANQPRQPARNPFTGYDQAGA